MGDVVDGEAQVVVAVLEGQGLGLLQQVPAQRPLQLQHLLRAAGPAASDPGGEQGLLLSPLQTQSQACPGNSAKPRGRPP